jgi:hypothetical protein
MMHKAVAAAIILGLGLMLNPADAADLVRKAPLVLSESQLEQVTAAGTGFVGVAQGNTVLFSRIIRDVPVEGGYSETITQIGDITVVTILTEADTLTALPAPFKPKP